MKWDKHWKTEGNEKMVQILVDGDSNIYRVSANLWSKKILNSKPKSESELYYKISIIGNVPKPNYQYFIKIK